MMFDIDYMVFQLGFLGKFMAEPYQSCFNIPQHVLYSPRSAEMFLPFNTNYLRIVYDGHVVRRVGFGYPKVRKVFNNLMQELRPVYLDTVKTMRYEDGKKHRALIYGFHKTNAGNRYITAIFALGFYKGKFAYCKRFTLTNSETFNWVFKPGDDRSEEIMHSNGIGIYGLEDRKDVNTVPIYLTEYEKVKLVEQQKKQVEFGGVVP